MDEIDGRFSRTAGVDVRARAARLIDRAYGRNIACQVICVTIRIFGNDAKFCKYTCKVFQMVLLEAVLGVAAVRLLRARVL